MNKPWELYDMTENEWRQYEDEYANYLDALERLKSSEFVSEYKYNEYAL